jgi:hypothetical protein
MCVVSVVKMCLHVLKSMCEWEPKSMCAHVSVGVSMPVTVRYVYVCVYSSAGDSVYISMSVCRFLCDGFEVMSTEVHFSQEQPGLGLSILFLQPSKCLPAILRSADFPPHPLPLWSRDSNKLITSPKRARLVSLNPDWVFFP